MLRLTFEGSIPADLVDTAIAFVSSYEITSLLIAWFGNDLEEMLGDRKSLAIIDTAGLAAQAYTDELDEDGGVAVALTDYKEWVAGQWAREDSSIESLRERGRVRAFEDLASAPAVTQLVFDGSAPFLRDAATQFRVPAKERAEAVESWQACKAGAVFDGLGLWQSTLDRIAKGWSVSEAAGSAERIGQLNAALGSIPIRDGVIVYALRDDFERFKDVDLADISKQLDQAMGKKSARHEVIVDLLVHLARYSDESDPAAFATAAYVAWWCGHMQQAFELACEALDSDFNHRLALLVLEAITAADCAPCEAEEVDAYV